MPLAVADTLEDRRQFARREGYGMGQSHVV